MANVIYSGYLDVSTRSVPYTIMDMNESFANINEAKLRLLQYAVGGINSTASIAISDNSIYQSIPNPMVSGTLPAQSQIAFNADSGVGIASSAFNGTSSRLESNGYFSTNSYMGIAAPNVSSLYFHLRNNNADININGTRYNYGNGVFFEHVFSDGACPARWWFDNDGIAYFVHGASYNIKLGYLAKGTTSFNYIGELNPLKLYAVRAIPSFASGIVKDAAGNAAPNRKLAAFKRSDFKLVGVAMSGDDGSYLMQLFAAKGEVLFFVCLDDDAAPDFEAQIYDRIIVG